MKEKGLNSSSNKYNLLHYNKVLNYVKESRIMDINFPRIRYPILMEKGMKEHFRPN